VITVSSKKNLILKIGVPAAIVCFIIIIWAVKNHKLLTTNETTNNSIITSNNEIKNTTSVITATETTTENTVINSTDETDAAVTTKQQINKDNPDFALDYTDGTDIEHLKSYHLPIIIDFGADWCGPCQELAPIIEELNNELRGKAIIKFVNTDSGLSIIDNYDFQYIPMQIFIDSNGKPYNHVNDDEWENKYDPDTNELMYTMHTGVLQKEVLLSILKEMGME